MSKYINSLFKAGFVYTHANFVLKIYFSNNNELFFDSMADLISKMEGLPEDI